MERKLGLQTVIMLHHTDVCSVSWLSRGSDFTAVGISFHFIFFPQSITNALPVLVMHWGK